MLTTLVAALTLAASLAVDVPYLPQTEGLCGGAAAAMVFRYWGDAHADPQQFGPIVDRRAGGIGDRDLVNAIDARGWRTDRADGTIEILERRLRDSQPVIVLLEDRRDRYHYVVVVGMRDDAVVVHDPSWGPSRPVRRDEFVRLWKPSGFWSLVILPGDTRPVGADRRVGPANPAASSGADTSVRPYEKDTRVRANETRERCDALLDDAIADVQRRGLDEADAIFARVRAECPDSPGPARELAGVRFAQRRWGEAAALSREALARDSHDAYALDVLGSSLFMLDDPVGALRAWNQIGRPRVDLVRIEGIHRSRYQAVADALRIQPNMLLTADLFQRTRRRLAELPDQAAARLGIRPEQDGFAAVEVVIAERPSLPHGALEWTATAARTAIDRQATVSAPGLTGQGDAWTASWRWWANRPLVAVSYAAPRLAGLPGVWRFDASWQRETYANGSAASTTLFDKSRAHGGLTVSDWLSGSIRYSLSAGLAAFAREHAGVLKAASIGGSIERRWFDDRVSAAIEATRWIPVAHDAGFQSVDARADWRSSTFTRGWVYRGGGGVEHVSDNAPLTLWPGAGDGHARAPLLRAHPLLNEGIIDVTRSAFGTTLAYGNAEALRWFDRPALVRMGIAGFADVGVRPRLRLTGGSDPVQMDVGLGLRIKIPGAEGVLRVDAARGVRDGANALTVGWLFQ